MCLELFLSWNRILQCAWVTVVYLSTKVLMQGSMNTACIDLSSCFVLCSCGAYISTPNLVHERSAGRYIPSSLPLSVHTVNQRSLRTSRANQCLHTVKPSLRSLESPSVKPVLMDTIEHESTVALNAELELG